MLVSKSHLTACALAAALSSAAGQTGAASASVQISNVRIELIDLDPNDQITPWVQFGYRDVAMNANLNDGGELQEIFWPGSVQLSRPYGEAAAMVGDGIMRSSAQIRDSRLAGGARVSALGSDWRMFELSPNTQLKLTLSVSLQADDGLGESSRAVASIYGYVSAFDQSGTPDQFDDKLQNFSGARTVDYRSTLSTGQAAGHGTIGWAAYSYAQGSAAPVPEPASYAMLLAGLAAIGTCRLRRRD
ncbi:PEP-CTERM sorting domain-containing protein [Massilia sp. DJPM01]|uniref:PEP-CTERM sorting domain-containing protein n=1 Tax=Massilia sp. DJPM01 TaxID=3024404 RepID=UPI00259F62CC|nr:PEP-CTERM sorting domain-containing protein [Massilia sp. DJPM01]MDM5177442.1 PEP-CTERM sorting domain-containing protein [Massilia sp. DJPM01]